MRINGVRKLGIQSLDTLTDEAYRGKGLFIRLAKALYNRCSSNNIFLIYGFPNLNSAHGFFKKLNWNSLDPMPFMLRPLRSKYILNKLGFSSSLSRLFDFPIWTGKFQGKYGHNLRMETLNTVGSEFNAVWSAFSSEIKFSVERDATYLNWRLNRPNEHYQSIALFENDIPIGLAVIGCNYQKNGSKIGKIMELIYNPKSKFAANLLIKESLNRLSELGCEAVWAWNFYHSINHSTFFKSGFIAIPTKWHPHKIHIGAYSFVGDINVGHRKDWYVSLLDSDTH